MNNLNSCCPFLKIVYQIAFIAITNWARFIRNWGSFDYKLRLLLKIITNYGRTYYCKQGQNYYKLRYICYKSGWLLQIEAITTNQCTKAVTDNRRNSNNSSGDGSSVNTGISSGSCQLVVIVVVVVVVGGWQMVVVVVVGGGS